MDPNPHAFPVLSYVMDRIASIGTKTTADSAAGYDIEQADPSSSSAQIQTLTDRMPHLMDPKLLSSMTFAIHDVYQTRSVLQTLGPRPDHETVDKARAKLAEIETNLSKSLEEIVLSPRPVDVDRFQWRAHLAERENECREKAEKEKNVYKTILQLDEMHDSYEKMLKDAEQRLVKIYERAENADGSEVLPVSEQVNEEVVGLLQEASGKCLERVDLSGRRLRFLPEAFGRIAGLKVLNLSSNQLEVTSTPLSYQYINF